MEFTVTEALIFIAHVYLWHLWVIGSYVLKFLPLQCIRDKAIVLFCPLNLNQDSLCTSKSLRFDRKQQCMYKVVVFLIMLVTFLVYHFPWSHKGHKYAVTLPWHSTSCACGHGNNGLVLSSLKFDFWFHFLGIRGLLFEVPEQTTLQNYFNFTTFEFWCSSLWQSSSQPSRTAGASYLLTAADAFKLHLISVA